MRPPELIKISPVIWELPVSYKTGMRVPARIYATEKLIDQMDSGVFDQVSNVAMLPGIVNYSFCMPDGHWGYGFPIGGVAAMDTDDGVISPGGIGFDINCGMRLMLTSLTYDELKPKLHKLVDKLFNNVPTGVGEKSRYAISKSDFRKVMINGSRWCIENGFGWQEDLLRTEETGCIDGADPSKVSDKAVERGYHQLGTLGSGNHYLEIQVVKRESIFDAKTAESIGIFPDQVVIMFHCGSRGFGHQIATDYLRVFLKAMPEYGISVPDRELACAPFRSGVGQDYFSAMKCAINMSFANRQMIAHQVREVFADVFGVSAIRLSIHQVYDIAHNTAKLEYHDVNGVRKRLLVHRKGSTRAFGPDMEGIPQEYKKTGQPVIIGGSMETGSYLLSGVKSGKQTFYSTTHGSGRVMSRKQARKQFRGKELQMRMEKEGIYTRSVSYGGLAEEAGKAYKNIDDVIDAASMAGISHPIVKFLPVGNIKG